MLALLRSGQMPDQVRYQSRLFIGLQHPPEHSRLFEISGTVEVASLWRCATVTAWLGLGASLAGNPAATRRCSWRMATACVTCARSLRCRRARRSLGDYRAVSLETLRQFVVLGYGVTILPVLAIHAPGADLRVIVREKMCDLRTIAPY